MRMKDKVAFVTGAAGGMAAFQLAMAGVKVLMTGTYVDPETHVVYRANRLPDGTVQLVSPDVATNPVSALSLGQAKQAITAGAEMPEVILVTATETSGGSL